MKFVFSDADRFACELGLEENRFHPIVPSIRIEVLNGLTDLTNYQDVAGSSSLTSCATVCSAVSSDNEPPPGRK